MNEEMKQKLRRFIKTATPGDITYIANTKIRFDGQQDMLDGMFLPQLTIFNGPLSEFYSSRYPGGGFTFLGTKKIDELIDNFCSYCGQC